MASVRKTISNLPVKIALEGELLPGQLLVEILGFDRVLIENHCGVIKYEPGEIWARGRRCIVCICGSQLQLARMSQNQLVITGKIYSVYQQKGEKG